MNLNELEREREKLRGTHWEFVRGRRRRREVDVEVHGAAESWAEMFEPLVVAAEHLAAANLGGFRLHRVILIRTLEQSKRGSMSSYS